MLWKKGIKNLFGENNETKNEKKKKKNVKKLNVLKSEKKKKVKNNHKMLFIFTHKIL